MKKIKKVAMDAIKKAGKYAMHEYKKFDRKNVRLKHHREILTDIDLGSEKIIIKEIKKNFPEHNVLSEEAGFNKKKSDYLWIIDPIDGTTNFSIHNPMWAISIGVAYKDKIVLGFIYAPALDEIYFAEINKGAYLNNKKLKVSGDNKGKIVNTFCHSRSDKDTKKAVKYYSYQKLHGFDCRQLGSAALELAYVAGGRVESIAIPGANSWDVSAGVLLVREAGGKVTDFLGKKWSIKSKDILASNGKVHSNILKVLNNL